MHRKYTALLLALVVCLLQSSPRLTAATSSEDAEMRRRTEEVERLRQQLQRAEDELKRLQSGETKPGKAEPPKSAAPSPALSPSPPSSPVPLQTLPPLQRGDVVDANELVSQFRADAALAEARYRKQVFALRGEVVRFSPKIARRVYDVILRSPDPQVELIFAFGYEELFRSVYTRERGRTLVARVEGTGEKPLFRAGETVVIRGRCAGLKKGVLHFSRCERLP